MERVVDFLVRVFNSLASVFLNLARFIFPFHAAAWRASVNSIRCLLNASDDEEKNRLTALWRDSIQSQLTSIAITVGFPLTLPL